MFGCGIFYENCFDEFIEKFMVEEVNVMILVSKQLFCVKSFINFKKFLKVLSEVMVCIVFD